MSRSFYFPAKANEVPRYARQILGALGEDFDHSLIMASVSESLLNAIAYGALGLPASAPDRDPLEFSQALQRATARLGPDVGIQVEVCAAKDIPGDKLVTISDPGSGFDWRAKLNALADKPVRPSADDYLETSGRGISMMLAAARGVLWNDAGNEVTLRYRSPLAPPPESNPPPPVRLKVTSDQRFISPTARTLRQTRAVDQVGVQSPPATPPPARTDETNHERPTITRVMVVDDEAVNRRVLEHMLNWEGYEVRLATDGPSALEILDDWVPDIMVLDFNMPKMTGIEVVRAMGKRKLLSRISVLLLTAATIDDQTRAEGLDAGACDFLEKPISRRELIARIQRRRLMQRTLQKLSDEREQLEGSVSAAAEVIRALMPEPRIEVEDAVISSLVIPCDGVGGDVVDFVRIDEQRWLVSLIDVAGHGLAAALTASATRAILRDRLISGRSLSDAVAALNARLSEDFDRTGQHVAVAAVLVNRGRGTAQVLNAGCPPALLLGRNGSWDTVKSSSPPAGLLSDVEFTSTTVQLTSLKRVILVSDGLTEGFSRSSDALGALRLVVGADELDNRTEVPTDRVRSKVNQLGPNRDDASIAWIQFCRSA